jgi:V/A-type H+/Na+-transporting ATPase subunit D
MRLRIPPGRAGRLWLRDRLASARSAADLLDHKRRELESERARVGTILAQRTRAWRRAMAEAERWLARTDATAGGRAMRMAAALEPTVADVTLAWRQIMGVHYPIDIDVVLPAAPSVASLDGGAALTGALAAYRAAVEAATAHAVARTAHERICAELERTIRRLRALELRAIPAHQQALDALELQLDERDREEGVSARWAAGAQPGERTR